MLVKTWISDSLKTTAIKARGENLIISLTSHYQTVTKKILQPYKIHIALDHALTDMPQSVSDRLNSYRQLKW